MNILFWKEIYEKNTSQVTTHKSVNVSRESHLKKKVSLVLLLLVNRFEPLIQ